MDRFRLACYIDESAIRASIQAYLRRHRGLEGYHLEVVRYHSQSLFPLYRLELRDVRGGRYCRKLLLAGKLTRNGRMARTEEEGLKALGERGAPVPATYGYCIMQQERQARSRGEGSAGSGEAAAGSGAGDRVGRGASWQAGGSAGGSADDPVDDPEERPALLLMQFLSRASPPLTAPLEAPGEGATAAVPALRDDLMLLYSKGGERFGWHEANYIGSLPQPNRWHRRFIDFWWQERIEPQLRMAWDQGRLSKRWVEELRRLTVRCGEAWRLNDAAPKLIHGDLWSGNLLEGPGGRSYLIDPSVSCGNPEQDLAMLDLFGSPLGSEDKEQIARQYGSGAGYSGRRPFWQIYPLLVHLNIFGSSYLRSLEAALRSCRSGSS